MRICRYILVLSFIVSVKGQCACSSSKLGDGVCDEDCYSEDCEWDNEDCKNAECVLGCLNSWIGDSTCHNACYVESCQYDNGDCQTEECAVGCRNSMVGDNTCQENCFNQACNYDSSDCQKCAEECAEFQIGDGVCQRECFNKDCDWDKQDCGTQCATGCEISYLGNKKCEAACNNSDCNNDEGDCIDLCSTSGCRSSKLGNGVCDKECNISVCEYDAGDCTKLSFFSKEYNVTSTEDEEEEYEPDNFGKVGGVGLGVMLTIIACIVGVLLCIIGAATPYKLVFLIIGICIPLIVFLVVALAPTKKDVEDEKDDRSDKSMVPRYIILAMLIVASLIGALRLMEYYLGINVKARRVDSRINNGPAESDLLIENADSAQVTSPNNQKLEIEEEIPRGFPKFKEVEMEEFSPFTSDSVSGRIPKRYPV
jgi:hypothetical protein